MKKIDLHIHTKTSVLDSDFEFSQNKLEEYIQAAELDGIAITNHNLFDREQFEDIRNRIDIPAFPGIEVDLEKGQLLVIDDGSDLDGFEEKCVEVSYRCSSIGDRLSTDEFIEIFGELRRYILIPHYEKKPALEPETLRKLLPHVTAGEVSSPKKFMYCIKSDERLVPLYFSDCRISSELAPLPTRQTFLDCSAITFSTIKECAEYSSGNMCRHQGTHMTVADFLALRFVVRSITWTGCFGHFSASNSIPNDLLT